MFAITETERAEKQARIDAARLRGGDAQSERRLRVQQARLDCAEVKAEAAAPGRALVAYDARMTEAAAMPSAEQRWPLVASAALGIGWAIGSGLKLGAFLGAAFLALVAIVGGMAALFERLALGAKLAAIAERVASSLP